MTFEAPSEEAAASLHALPEVGWRDLEDLLDFVRGEIVHFVEEERLRNASGSLDRHCPKPPRILRF